MKFISQVLLLFCCATIALLAKSGEPEIRKEVRKVNGKNVEYMWINGIKVHESDPKKQPQPPVVEPKLHDAKAAKAPKGAGPNGPWANMGPMEPEPIDSQMALALAIASASFSWTSNHPL